MDCTVISPWATTFTMPPPAVASAVIVLISSWAFASSALHLLRLAHHLLHIHERFSF